MKAWLITWEWTGESAAIADKIVGILNPRWSIKRVLMIVEFIYNQNTSTLSEMSNYAKRPSNNPYTSKKDFNSHIFCGSHPWIEARLVEDLYISVNPNTGIETIKWNEMPIYEPDDQTIGPKLVRGKLPKTYVRKLTGSISNESIWDRENGKYKDWWLKLAD
ncbi:MAG: hypothetical protein K8R58_06120 [Bacteroidales bacterium]|nr:hypothetical protein [Bacteroidales bacterium]